MQVILQETEKECGVCIVTMLANELHDQYVTREDVVEKANLTSAGLSLYDLESLASEFGVELETYECTLEEFKDLNRSKYYVVLVKRMNGLHYVIVQKYQQHLMIFDSSVGRYKTNWKTFQNEFAGIVSTVSKKNIEINLTNTNNQLKFDNFVNWQLLIAAFLLEILAISFGVGVAQLFKVLVNETIQYQTTFNLLVIVVTFVFMKIVEILANELIKWIQSRKFQAIYIKSWNKIATNLQYQKFDFLKLHPYGNLYELDHHLMTVINVYLSQIIKVLAGVMMLITVIGFLASINMWFILLSLIQTVFSTILIYGNYRWQKLKISKTIIFTEKHNQNLSELNASFSIEQNNLEYRAIIKNLKENIRQMAINNKMNFMGQSAFNVVSTFARFLFGVITLWIGIEYIVNFKSMTLSDLVFVISLQALLTSYSDHIVEFSLNFNNFKIAKHKLAKFLIPDYKMITKNEFAISKVKKINFHNISLDDGPKKVFKNLNLEFKNLTLLSGENAVGKSTIFKTITKKIKLSSGTIKINDINLDKISDQWIIENVYYLDGTKRTEGMLLYENVIESLKLVKNPKIIEILQNAGFFETSLENYSNGQQQLCRLIQILNLENKIILLDEMTNNLSIDLKKMVYEQIIKEIALNNFVLIIDHGPIVEKYVNQKIEITSHEA